MESIFLEIKNTTDILEKGNVESLFLEIKNTTDILEKGNVESIFLDLPLIYLPKPFTPHLSLHYQDSNNPPREL